jgi:GNAT superfamily N-acetyltransferase
MQLDPSRGDLSAGPAHDGAAATCPAQRTEECRMADGMSWRLRPIRASDLAMHTRFAGDLSAATHYARFLSPRKLGQAELTRMTDIDYTSELALVGTIELAGEEREIGVARYVTTTDGSAGVAVVVADSWQRRGVAETLLRRLIAAAVDNGVQRFEDIALYDNRAVLGLARKLGFTARRDPRDPFLIALSLPLTH